MKNRGEINGKKTLKKQLWCRDEGVQRKEDPGACSPGDWCLLWRWLPKCVGAKGPASNLVHLPSETLYQSLLVGCLKKKPGHFLAGGVRLAISCSPHPRNHRMDQDLYVTKMIGQAGWLPSEIGSERMHEEQQSGELTQRSS